MVTQVPIIGILMIVNGSLMTLMGLLLAALGPIITIFEPAGQRGGPPTALVAILYTTLGVVALMAS